MKKMFEASVLIAYNENMDNFSRTAFETGKEILKDTADKAGEQLGTKKEKGHTESSKDQFNFVKEFREQILGDRTEKQLQQEELSAKNNIIKDKEKIAFTRQRLKELSTPTPRQSNPYEYHGPEVSTQQGISAQRFESQGPQVPQQPAPSSLDYAKQGSNEMMKKMVG